MRCFAQNLLLKSDAVDSEIKIIDFGLSRRYDQTSYMRRRVGTPYYQVRKGNLLLGRGGGGVRAG